MTTDERPTTMECEAAFRDACDDPESTHSLRRGIAALRAQGVECVGDATPERAKEGK